VIVTSNPAPATNRWSNPRGSAFFCVGDLNPCVCEAGAVSEAVFRMACGGGLGPPRRGVGQVPPHYKSKWSDPGGLPFSAQRLRVSKDEAKVKPRPVRMKMGKHPRSGRLPFHGYFDLGRCGESTIRSTDYLIVDRPSPLLLRRETWVRGPGFLPSGAQISGFIIRIDSRPSG